jgi:hypothetical protein
MNQKTTIFQRLRELGDIREARLGVGSLTLGFHHNDEPPEKNTLTVRLPEGDIERLIRVKEPIRGQLHSSSDVLIHKDNILGKTGFWADLPHLDCLSIVTHFELLGILDTEEPLEPWTSVIRTTKIELDLSLGNLRGRSLEIPLYLTRALDHITVLHVALELNWSEYGVSKREQLT